MIIVCWNNFIYSWFSQKGILQEQGFISALLHALRNFVLFSYKLACRTGVIFFAYFWRTEAKSRRAPNVSCARGKERKFFFSLLSSRGTRASRFTTSRATRASISDWISAFQYHQWTEIGRTITVKKSILLSNRLLNQNVAHLVK